jgi:hypothetical protein
VQRLELVVIDPEVVAKLLAADGPDEHGYPSWALRSPTAEFPRGLAG